MDYKPHPADMQALPYNAVLQRCPKCQAETLRVRNATRGETHECVAPDCGYLMTWARRKAHR